MHITLIRHAETNSIAELPGDPDGLSPAGKKQLDHLIIVCRNNDVKAVISSEVRRAVSTAAALAEALNVPLIQQSGLEERDFGDWNSKAWADIKADLDTMTTEERYSFIPPHGESWEQMEARLRKALRDIVAQPYQSIAIVTHYGTIRALLPILKHEPKETTLQLEVANGESFTLQYDGQWRVQSW
jgi:alpha-ribazole phosphatase